MEYVIEKPLSVSKYASHRLVAGLTQGRPASWVDQGDHLVVRTQDPIALSGKSLRMFSEGETVGFHLKASCGKKVRGKTIYFPSHDWRSRHEWLRRKAQLHGFEVLTVHCQANKLCMTAHARDFYIDSTLFTGVLKVLDVAKFHAAVLSGIGSTAKAFGFGFLQF